MRACLIFHTSKMIGSTLLLGEKQVRASAPKILNPFGKMGGNQWDALRAAESVGQKSESLILVPGAGVQPARGFPQRILSPSCLAVPSPRHVLEARVGIEPTYKGFADPSLTTWVPRR